MYIAILVTCILQSTNSNVHAHRRKHWCTHAHTETKHTNAPCRTHTTTSTMLDCPDSLPGIHELIYYKCSSLYCKIYYFSVHQPSQFWAHEVCKNKSLITDLCFLDLSSNKLTAQLQMQQYSNCWKEEKILLCNKGLLIYVIKCNLE